MYISLTAKYESFPCVEIKWQIVILCKTNKKINAIIVNIRLIKMKNRWKYSVNQCLFDGNIIFVLKDSHEKNMFVLNSSSIQFHVSIISCKFRSPVNTPVTLSRSTLTIPYDLANRGTSEGIIMRTGIRVSGRGMSVVVGNGQ